METSTISPILIHLFIIGALCIMAVIKAAIILFTSKGKYLSVMSGGFIFIQVVIDFILVCIFDIPFFYAVVGSLCITFIILWLFEAVQKLVAKSKMIE